MDNKIELYDKFNIINEKDFNVFLPMQFKECKIRTERSKIKFIKDKIIYCKKSIILFFIFILIFFIISILFCTYLKYGKKNWKNIIKNIINKSPSSINKNNIKEIENNKKTYKDKEKWKEDIIKDKEKIKEGQEEDEKEEEVIKPSIDDIYRRESFDEFETSFRKARSYLESCMKGELLHKEPLVKSKKPKVTAIVPVYNSQNMVNHAVKSIQNQNMLDIEIILVNDFSTDNTSFVLKKLEKEDPRIKIIENKKNMGILYSRSIGALSAKGNYIFPLDNDDMFLDKDVFKTISDRAIKGNFDIIEFRPIFILKSKDPFFKRRRIEKTLNPYGDNIVLFQPKLGAFPLQKGQSYGRYKILSVYLWTKCIKTKVYQKALKLLGEKRYSRFMLCDEDVLVNYIIFNVAESFKFLGKYGVIRILRESSASAQTNHIQINKQVLYVLDAALDFSKNLKENKEWIIYYATFLINRNKLEETLKINYFNKMFISCLDRIFKTQAEYFYEKDKAEIKRRVLEKKFINYTF
jgi:glycosyltransferase involved in cell wall biosynthesis